MAWSLSDSQTTAGGCYSGVVTAGMFNATEGMNAVKKLRDLPRLPTWNEWKALVAHRVMKEYLRGKFYVYFEKGSTADMTSRMSYKTKRDIRKAAGQILALSGEEPWI